MIHLINFIVKIALTLFVLMSYNIYGLASLISWDKKFIEICDISLEKIWYKN